MCAHVSNYVSEFACHVHAASVSGVQLALCLLLLTIFSSITSHLPSLLQSVLPIRSMPALYASCCTVLRYFSKYCKIKDVFFLLCVCVFFLMYYWCENHSKPVTVQVYVLTGCVCALSPI